MRKRKILHKDLLGYFIVLSILIHLLFVRLMPINIDLLSKKTDEDIVILEPLKNKINQIKPEEKFKEKGEIVDLATPSDNRIPKDTKYLSDKNRVTDKETEARIKTHIFNPNKFMLKNQKMQNTNKKFNEILKKDGEMESKNKELAIIKPEEKKREAYDLFLKSQANSSAPYDPNYLKDLEEGETTRLNTREFLYSSFFTRVKRQIAGHWKPDDAFAKVYNVNPGNAPKLLSTSVEITLNNTGHLTNIFVSKSSGYESWDNESVRCVKEASPFLNPPQGLIDPSGYVTFPFTFIGELTVGVFYRITR
jgi:TonB family protein